ISARVLDIAGNFLPNVVVSFITDAGLVSPSSNTTDASGLATTTLTTTRTSKITATAGIGVTGASGSTSTTAQSKDLTVTVNVGPTVSLGAPTPVNPGVGQPMSITMTIGTPGTGQSPIRSASINWGDGFSTSVGTATATVQHTYTRAGTFAI